MSPRWTAVAGLAAIVAMTSLGAGRETTLDGFERFVRDDGSFTFPGESVRDGLVHLGNLPARDSDWVYTDGYPRLGR